MFWRSQFAGAANRETRDLSGRMAAVETRDEAWVFLAERIATAFRKDNCWNSIMHLSL
jgi:hypothetical protein